MKKDTAIKKLTTYHSDILNSVHKIRDLIYAIDDDELTDKVDAWVEDFESYIDEGGSIEELSDGVEEVLSMGE
jgi:hypothetical protein